MSELDKHSSQLPMAPVKWRFPSIHPEGRKFVVIAGAVAFLTYFMISHFIGLFLLGVVRTAD